MHPLDRYLTRAINYVACLCDKLPPPKVTFGTEYPDLAEFDLEEGRPVIKLNADWAEFTATELEIRAAVAHEFRHFEQWLRGELTKDPDGVWLWQGRPLGLWDYETAPWELEAREAEEAMYA